jgi:lysophospholipid acyltransferase (LPLAT)-like uncharacterized protein
MEDRGDVLRVAAKGSLIFAVWHNRLLLLCSIFERFLPGQPAAALISVSSDGDFIAALVERYGYGTVRGSSSRKGASALLRLAEVLAEGTHLVITPDGPRGPAYELSPGVIFLAQKSKTAVVPTSLEFSSTWRAKSWDRFFVPLPCCHVRVIFGTPLNINETETDEAFEQERKRLQDAMVNLVEEK